MVYEQILTETTNKQGKVENEIMGTPLFLITGKCKVSM
jgi:hypothetical protein